MIKTHLLFLMAMLLPVSAALGQIDHQISFKIKNFGVNVDGYFEQTTVNGTLDLAKPGNTKLTATLAVNSINTDNETRDAHLLEDDYFDAVNYPQIRFESTALSTSGANNYRLKGKLTIKGITKEVVIPLTLQNSAGYQTLVGDLFINRRDFKVGGGSLILSKTVSITVRLQIPRS